MNSQPTSPPAMPTPAVFLDKDGTLIEDVPYNVDPQKIRFATGAIAALQRIHAAGYQLLIITNQSGVARGFFPESALLPVRQYLSDQLVWAGVPLTGFYYCPHHPDGIVEPYAIACTCRKPGPGLLQQAAIDHHIDLTRSWMVGDILNDIEAGRSAGCKTILIDNGNETEWQLSEQRVPHYTVANLVKAAEIITQAGSSPLIRSHPQSHPHPLSATP